MLKKMLMLAAVLLTTATGAEAQECTADDVTTEEWFDLGIFAGCFELWTGCREIGTLVRLVNRSSVEIEENDIKNVLESRLRAAGVFRPGPLEPRGSFFYIAVTLETETYEVHWRFSKAGEFRDSYGFTGRTSTWSGTGSGLHEGGEHRVMDRVRGDIDDFIIAFLWVNEPACSRR